MILRKLAICGILMVIGYIGVFSLLQSKALWYTLSPDPMQSLLPGLFQPIGDLFPTRWLYLNRTHKFALLLAAAYLVVIPFLFAVHAYTLRQVSRESAWRQEYVRPALRRIFGFTGVILLILLFVRGLLTTDIYSYAWYSRTWVDFGMSPYTHLPLEFAALDTQGWLRDHVFWTDWRSPYGPAWTIIAAAVYKIGQLGNGQIVYHVLALKVLIDLTHLLNAWLVWRIAGLLVQRRGPKQNDAPPAPARLRRPRLPAVGRPRRLGLGAHRLRVQATARAINSRQLGFQFGALLFYIWNPLLLIEFGANAHNDLVMVTFVLLAFWLHLSGRWRLAALALGVATLVKLPAVLFVPGYLWLVLWEGVRRASGPSLVSRAAGGVWRAAQALLIMLVAWVVLYIPFWEGPQTLQALTFEAGPTLYLHTFAESSLQHVPSFISNIAPWFGVQNAGPEFAAQVRSYLAQNVGTWLLLVSAVVAIVLTWRARTFERALTAWGWVAFVGILGHPYYWPWYAVWIVAPAIFSRSRRLRVATFVFCVSSLLQYAYEAVLLRHFTIFADLHGILIMAPPLVYLFFSWLVEVRRKRRTRRSTRQEVVREQPAMA